MSNPLELNVGDKVTVILSFTDRFRYLSGETGVVKPMGKIQWHDGKLIPFPDSQHLTSTFLSVETVEMMHNTTVKVKAEFFDMFSNMIKNQFVHGGDKYALEGFDDMEATDLICKLWEKPGFDEVKWILKTILKYMFRFKNFHREKDLLKMATYLYIIWLKMGFHLQKTHDEDVSKKGS